MSKKVIFSEKAPAAIGPYSQAIESNGMVYISGQIAIDNESGELKTENIEIETHQVMKNLSHVLESAKIDFSNIVKATIFMKDMNDYIKINEIYASYLQAPFPAREAVQVSVLPKNVNVEISVIAHI